MTRKPITRHEIERMIRRGAGKSGSQGTLATVNVSGDGTFDGQLTFSAYSGMLRVNQDGLVFGNSTTSNLPEGTNLYFTDERVDDRVSSLIQDGTGISWTYNDGAGTLTGNVTLSPFDTDDLSEGISNLYYTDERAQDAVGGMVDSTLTYVDATPTLGVADGGIGTTQLADDSVTNAKLDNMAEATIKGRSDGSGTGDPEDLSAGQLAALAGSSGIGNFFNNFGNRNFTTPVNDDTVVFYDIGRQFAALGFIITGGGAQGVAVLRLRTASTATAGIAAQTGPTFNVVAGDGSLNGTTGPDGNINIRTESSTDRVYIENRTGEPISVTLYHFE